MAGPAGAIDVVLVVVLGGPEGHRPLDHLGDDRLVPEGLGRLEFRDVLARADFACSADVQKIAERYWSPTSGPWRFSWVGSCMRKKPSSSWR